MNDILFSVEGVRVYTLSAFVFLAFLWFGFVFYKKAIEYHKAEETVLDLILLMGFSGLVISRIGFSVTRLDWFSGHWMRIFFIKEYPGFSGWGALLGSLLALMVVLVRRKEEIFDWLDMVSLGLAAGIPIVYAARGLLGYGGLAMGLAMSLWFVYLWWVEGEYRTFEWYRYRKTQAKTGFITGMLVFGWGGISLLLGGILRDLSLWPVDVSLVVLGPVLVYIRSGRSLNKDLGDLVSNSKNYLRCLRKKRIQK